MNEDFDFDYDAPAQTETVQQPARPAAPVQAQPVQQPVANAQPEQAASMAKLQIPDLRKGRLSVIPIGSRYWTPEFEGEAKYGVVRRFEDQVYEKIDDRTGEVSQETLRTLIFAEQREDLSWSVYSNCSKKLVGDIESAVKNGEIVPNQTGVHITYLGKVKNATNSFKHDDFDIRTVEFD